MRKRKENSDQNAVAELTREWLYKENKWLWEENKELKKENESLKEILAHLMDREHIVYIDDVKMWWRRARKI